jgi:hypothetical protein
MTNKQYLTEMVMVSAQNINESVPSAASEEKCPPVAPTTASPKLRRISTNHVAELDCWRAVAQGPSCRQKCCELILAPYLSCYWSLRRSFPTRGRRGWYRRWRYRASLVPPLTFEPHRHRCRVKARAWTERALKEQSAFKSDTKHPTLRDMSTRDQSKGERHVMNLEGAATKFYGL